MRDEFFKYDPSFIGDLVGNMSKYENRQIGNSLILVRDSCFETSIEKEYLDMELRNYNFKLKHKKDLHIDLRQRDEEAKCMICNYGDYGEKNLIVICDYCDLAVHQDCYGIN